jgi:hypothetical protein
MWEFGIENVSTNEKSIIFGYSVADAFRRHPSLNREEWSVWYSEYVD